MSLTPYPHINLLIESISSHIKFVLGDKLVGLYLEGSLILGDFDPSVSDIDLLAALSSEVSDTEFTQLQEMYANFSKEYPEWHDRIETCFITVKALGKVKTETSRIINISPGEPLNRRESSIEWIVNWYVSRQKSIAIFGPDITTLIEPISDSEFVQGVRYLTPSWKNYIHDMKTKGSQAYAILTLCRALYAVTNGEQVSKKKAGIWVQQQFPEYEELVDKAFEWRQQQWTAENIVGAEETFSETKKFVLEMVDKISELY